MKGWGGGGMLTKSKLSSPLCDAGSAGDMWIWICIPISSKKQFQGRSACFEKKEKKLSTCPNEMNPKPTRNTNFAKFSHKNLAQLGLQKCLFRYGENVFFRKTLFLRARFPVRRDICMHSPKKVNVFDMWQRMIMRHHETICFIILHVRKHWQNQCHTESRCSTSESRPRGKRTRILGQTQFENLQTKPLP